MENHGADEGIPKSVVLIGEAGIGKTTWASKIAIYPMRYITHLDQLKTVEKEVKTLIFDDMSFAHIPREAQIQLLDRQCERAIHIRYGVASIRVGVKCIFLSNKVEFINLEDTAIKRRCYVINLINSIFA